MNTRLGYKDALAWIIDNDDTEWLNEGPQAPPSVTTCLIADIFQSGDTDKVKRDLIKRMKK